MFKVFGNASLAILGAVLMMRLSLAYSGGGSWWLGALHTQAGQNSKR